MGGKGSGIARKPSRLPRKRRRRDPESAVARLDARRPDVRAVMAGVTAITEDLGGELSFLARRMAHRIMHIDVLLMRDEAAMAQGKPIDTQAYLSGCASWHRLATTLGLERRARPVKRLADVIAEHTSSSPPPVGDVAEFSSRDEHPQDPAAGTGDST